jgi:hypothetical protein
MPTKKIPMNNKAPPMSLKVNDSIHHTVKKSAKSAINRLIYRFLGPGGVE